jgi:hypothetical protein
MREFTRDFNLVFPLLQIHSGFKTADTSTAKPQAHYSSVNACLNHETRTGQVLTQRHSAAERNQKRGRRQTTEARRTQRRRSSLSQENFAEKASTIPFAFPWVQGKLIWKWSQSKNRMHRRAAKKRPNLHEFLSRAHAAQEEAVEGAAGGGLLSRRSQRRHCLRILPNQKFLSRNNRQLPTQQ